MEKYIIPKNRTDDITKIFRDNKGAGSDLKENPLTGVCFSWENLYVNNSTVNFGE
jgi:hypothetical protein